MDNEIEKMTAKERTMKQLEDGIKSVLDSKSFAHWCEKQSCLYFNKYSFRNAMLVFLQNENASYVRGFEAWKEFGRQVKAGSKGISIIAPVFVQENKGKGSLFMAIDNNCNKQLKENEALEYAKFKLAETGLTFNRYRNGLYDVATNGRTVKAHVTQDEIKRFLQNNVINKIPAYYTVRAVFDVADTTDKEPFLWVKSYNKEELVLDDTGKPIKNSKGQYKIYNTEERKAAFNKNEFHMGIENENPEKAEILYNVLKTVSERAGNIVYESDVKEDEILAAGSLGYYSKTESKIVISNKLNSTERVSVLMHEIAHSRMHNDLDELKNTLETMNKLSSEEINKILHMAAVESTNDYVDSNFYQELKDINMQNPDGTYGKTQDYYRIVTVNPVDGKLMPFNQKVYDSYEECAAALNELPEFELTGYDDIVYASYQLSNDREQQKIVITRNLKEMQAEAVAYMTASSFGINTEHKSFEYIADWSKGRELKELSQSLEYIYNESQKLMTDIEKELDERGLTLTLEPKNIEDISSKDKEKFMSDIEEKIINAHRHGQDTLEMLKTDNQFFIGTKAEETVKDCLLLTYENENILTAAQDSMTKFEASHDIKEMTYLKSQIEAMLENYDKNILHIAKMQIEIKELAKAQTDKIIQYKAEPLKVLHDLQNEIPSMKNLTENELKLIADSQFINLNYSKYLGADNAHFVAGALSQLENLKTVMSKNGTAIEINSCEHWTEEEIFKAGQVLHPKTANETLHDWENNIQKLKNEAQKQGKYFPYNKCRMNIYFTDNTGKLNTFATRIDIGDGQQKDIISHLESFKFNETELNEDLSEMINKFKDSLNDREYIPMRYAQQDNYNIEKKEEKELKPEPERGMNEWKSTIKEYMQQKVNCEHEQNEEINKQEQENSEKGKEENNVRTV